VKLNCNCGFEMEWREIGFVVKLVLNGSKGFNVNLPLVFLMLHIHLFYCIALSAFLLKH